MKLPLALATRGRVSGPGPARLSCPRPSPSPLLPSDPSLPRENPVSPSRALPWERRAGRTWSTRAKLSAKLRKIVSDTSSDPPSVPPSPLPWAAPPPGQTAMVRTGWPESPESKRRTNAQGNGRGEDGYDKRAGARYPVRSSLIYGQHGDLAPRLRYNTYVTDMQDIYRHACRLLRAHT